MKPKKRWVAFFSMSGSEIYNVSRMLGRFPDAVVTNRTTLEGVHQELLDVLEPHQLIMIPNRPSVEEYDTAIRDVGVKPTETLVTLHGYLRIVPSSVCDVYEIINCHPGQIKKYPELKGKDPQRRAINHSTIGTVLHRVTAGVDEGPILSSASCFNKWNTEEGVTHKLKELSAHLWIDLLRKEYSIGV
jgi:folate-dependent phosphoribosylglycinamide formyltransferase PurN